MRTWVYVDGLNLYYGALKRTNLKWLNLVELARVVLPAKLTIKKLKYFTAPVSGVVDKAAPRRQQTYISALETLPEVQVYKGRFIAKSIWRPVLNLPIANKRIQVHAPVTLPRGDHLVSNQQSRILSVGEHHPPGVRRPKRRTRRAPHPDAVLAEVHTLEEKGSDVNLASHLLNDAWKGQFDVAAVISNDTDLVEPIRMVTQERKRPVTIVCPGRWSAAPTLVAVASGKRYIRKSHLQAAQFPDPLPGAGIKKPAGW